MRKLLAILILLAIVPQMALADWEIKPRYFDFDSNDGFMDAGTWSNPYEIEDSWGNTRGTVEPRYFDFDSNDGFLDAGSSSNPYIIDWD